MSQQFQVALERAAALSLAAAITTGGGDYLLGHTWQHALVVAAIGFATAFAGRFGVEGTIDTLKAQGGTSS